MSETIKLLILAQTEPNISQKYVETVCTAGITDDLKWIRLYPIQKRINTAMPDYGKYDWIECEVRMNESNVDIRKESRKVDMDSITKVGSLCDDVKRKWEVRRRFLLQAGITVHRSLRAIWAAAKRNELSLCLFKPAHIVGFSAKDDSEEYSDAQKAIIDNFRNQGLLFSLLDSSSNLLQFKKVPYTFHCKIMDDDGQTSTMSVLDWEMSSLYRKGLKNHDKEQAKELALKKYNQYAAERDVYFILGTRNKQHNMKMNSKEDDKINPWSIIAVIPFPKSNQMEFDFGI